MPRDSTVKQSQIPRARGRSSSCDSRSVVRTGKSGEPFRQMSVSPKRNKKSMLSEARTDSKMSIGKTPQKQMRFTMTPVKSFQGSSTMQNTVKDNRPLQDKNYQAEMIYMIETFFLEINQAQVLNNTGSLKPMSLKVFVDATVVLFKIINVSEYITLTNYTEIIPQVAKNLRYHGLMNKSWLKTASALHSLPNVLGWLSWLTVLAKTKLSAMQEFQINGLPFEGIDEEEKAKNRRKFNLIIDCYKAWNDDRLDEEQQLMNEYVSKEYELLGITEADFERLKKENFAASKIHEETKKEYDAIASENEKLMQMIKELEAKEEEEVRLIESNKAELNKLNKSNAQLLKDIDSLIENKKEEETEIKKLETAIANQPMSAEERDMTLQLIADDKQCIEQLNKNLEELNKQIYLSDLKLMKLNKNVTELCDEYRPMLYSHTNENIGNVKITMTSLDIPVMVTSNASILNVIEEKIILLNELKKELESDLQEILKKFNSVRNEKENMQVEKNRLSLCRNENIEIQKQIEDEIAIAKEKYSEKEAEMKSEIEKMLRQKSEITTKMKDLDSQVSKLSNCQKEVEALRKRKIHLENQAKIFDGKLDKTIAEHLNELNKGTTNIKSGKHGKK